MYARMLFSVGVAALVGASPALAQTRGTVEFGAFASKSMYDNTLGMNDTWGGGGRIGAFLTPRLSLEFEGGHGMATRTLGRPDASVTVLSAGANLAFLQLGHRLTLLAGGGADHIDARFFSSYGFHGSVGAKLALSDNFALRADGVESWMNHKNGTNTALHLGVSIYRNPSHGMRTVYTPAAVVPVTYADSVSADETHRLRVAAANYTALRDSLGTTPAPVVAASSPEALSTMQQMVLFTRGSADLTPDAKQILGAKVGIFRDNPSMRIVITGFASQPGDSVANMSLGLRRAEATKAYLVSLGVAPVRIEIATKGAGELRVAGPLDANENAAANVANRRSEFRLLVADPYLVAPSTKP